MTTIADEVASLSPSARIDLFVIDASVLGGPVLRYYNGVNALSQPVVWQGETYNQMPIEAEGFDVRADGPAPRPLVRMSNQAGLTGALARQYRQLRGATFIRKTTRARYLDAVNFAGGVNPTADTSAAWPDEVWRFDRVARRNPTLIEWELTSPFDMEGVMVPRRQIRIYTCGVSRYRSPECGYAGGPVAKVDDTPTADPALDMCSLKVSGCKLRFGDHAELPIDIFPGAGTTRSV